ncbi:MAG: phosphoglucomutase (alpha-D-glucose-1,6-bisphosphate-dependent) [Trueperaceae bacterium]|nr:phosphoglucomutase (alpha-D-glucose-1,6-bisphosphate-dependent) [Trueperaceae bacterium]
MPVHPDAGHPAGPDAHAHVPRLVATYYTDAPDASDPRQRVAFGTSGHRGRSLEGSFNDAHVAAIAQAAAEHRRAAGIAGPLFLGADTHALSEPALRTALEVLAANGVDVVVERDLAPLPTPVVSHAILRHRTLHGHDADGLIVTPSHNPPGDGGIKYNPPHGGPAGTEVTRAIEARANELLAAGLAGVRRVAWRVALAAATTHRRDVVGPYVEDLRDAIDLEAVRAAGVRMGADPMGGASLATWDRIADAYALDLVIVDRTVDASFAFMPLDHDGQVRMDCSSPFAMANLLRLAGRFDVAFGNDPDADRHGIVVPGTGLLNPNAYLAVAIDYLLGHRPGWSRELAVGKTLVSSALIDRVVARHGRRLEEVPVGFKWFVDGLHAGRLAFGGEESAGASFLRRDGRAWTTDKDGVLLALLAAEITAVTGADPGVRHAALTAELGATAYRRVDAPANAAQKKALAALSSDAVTATELAGDPVTAVLTRAPGNDAPIGGLKVVTERGWFAARPSGTEDVYKIYAESFGGEAHLDRLIEEARALVDAAFAG